MVSIMLEGSNEFAKITHKQFGGVVASDLWSGGWYQ